VSLTDQQRELYAWLNPSPPEAHAGQTLEQARNTWADGFRHVCWLEGVGVPTEAEVLAELDRATP
jgi:hypothetical protein